MTMVYDLPFWLTIYMIYRIIYIIFFLYFYFSSNIVIILIACIIIYFLFKFIFCQHSLTLHLPFLISFSSLLSEIQNCLLMTMFMKTFTLVWTNLYILTCNIVSHYTGMANRGADKTLCFATECPSYIRTQGWC